VVSNPALESALPTKVNFTQKEWAAFGIAHLQKTTSQNLLRRINLVMNE